MKLLVGVMGFSILVCAALTLHRSGAGAARACSSRRFRPAAARYVLSLHRRHRRLDHDAVLQLLDARREDARRRHARLRARRRRDRLRVHGAVRHFDHADRQRRVLHRRRHASPTPQAVPKMAETLGAMLGPFGVYAFSVGFWAAVFASLLGVWQSVPYLYADFYGDRRRRSSAEARRSVVKVTSTPYRLALVFITLVPLPFAFTGRPIAIIVTYTIVGSLFVPFLAGTLLYLNNRVAWTGAGAAQLTGPRTCCWSRFWRCSSSSARRKRLERCDNPTSTLNRSVHLLQCVPVRAGFRRFSGLMDAPRAG